MRPTTVLAALATMCSLLGRAAEPGMLKWDGLPPLPDALGVAGPFTGVSGDALLVAGGANFLDGAPWEGGRKVWHDAVYVLADPAGAWRLTG